MGDGVTLAWVGILHKRTVQGYKDRHFGLSALLWLVILRARLSYLPQFHLPYPCGRALRLVVVGPSEL